MKKIMLVFGTRPEAIKMIPLAIEIAKSNILHPVICVTGQHQQMLESVLSTFDISPDYNLEIMKEQQTLFDITINILQGIKPIIEKETPDIVLVHGDTTTTYASALACFYLGVPIGHIEAGLRTYNIRSPFPEEFNRQSVSKIAKYHFAPTTQAKDNLIHDGVSEGDIIVTGNTAIDTLLITTKMKSSHNIFEWIGDSKLIVVTAHRRENYGEPMRNMFAAIRRILVEFDDIKVVYPIHMNPKIISLANEMFDGYDNIRLIEPLDVVEFHNLLNRSYIILTDSGGIQEEAPSLGKPVLVMRENTERPEGVQAGTLKLVGTNSNDIYNEFKKLLLDRDAYESMSKAINPYGDGFASKRIVEFLEGC